MNSKSLSERFFLVVCVIFGVIQAWITRYMISGDGVSYLDVGDAYFRRDWGKVINGYWSPMYSWLLGFALFISRPSIHWEFPVVHAVNLAIYFAALFCFRFFLHSIYRQARESTPSGDSVPLPGWTFLGLGYALFLWATLVLVEPGSVTPDLLVVTFLFLIGGYLIELRNRVSYGKFAIFGILCGFAYLAKAFMFPLGFVLLAVLLFSGKISSRRITGMLVAVFFFLMVSAPLVALLSKQKGRITFGDSGRIAYAGMVNPGIPPVHWQGDEEGSGIPKHATRKLLDNPPVFEFATPFISTYPPWYDPSYWEDGAKGTFRLRAQIRVLVQSVRNFTNMLLPQMGLLAGIFIFLLWGGTATRKAIISNWPLIVIALVSFGLYSLVLVRARYVAGFMVFLLIAILAGVRLPRESETSPVTGYISLAVMATIVLSISAVFAETAYMNMTIYGLPVYSDQETIAGELHAMGLQAGDPVAVINDGRNDLWARLGKFRIVAEVYAPDLERAVFWSQPEERRKLAYEALRRAGAKVVVVWAPPQSHEPKWMRVAETNYYAYFLTN